MIVIAVGSAQHKMLKKTPDLFNADQYLGKHKPNILRLSLAYLPFYTRVHKLKITQKIIKQVSKNEKSEHLE